MIKWCCLTTLIEGVTTMDCYHCITELPERKRGQHLQREERGAIQALKRQVLSNRAIARDLICSPTTVGNELKRDTPPRKSSKGRAPGYSAKRGEAVYRTNRCRSRKPHKLLSCGEFVSWTVVQLREHKWSLDACVGYARHHRMFSRSEMVCTRTLYREAWAGNLPIGITELPEAVKRKHTQAPKVHENRTHHGNSILSNRTWISSSRSFITKFFCFAFANSRRSRSKSILLISNCLDGVMPCVTGSI